MIGRGRKEQYKDAQLRNRFVKRKYRRVSFTFGAVRVEIARQQRFL